MESGVAFSHKDFDLKKFDDILNFLNEFSDYDISNLIINIRELKNYKDDLFELFQSLEDTNKYSDVGTDNDRLQFKLLSFSIK